MRRGDLLVYNCQQSEYGHETEVSYLIGDEND